MSKSSTLNLDRQDPIIRHLNEKYRDVDTYVPIHAPGFGSAALRVLGGGEPDPILTKTPWLLRVLGMGRSR